MAGARGGVIDGCPVRSHVRNAKVFEVAHAVGTLYVWQTFFYFASKCQPSRTSCKLCRIVYVNFVILVNTWSLMSLVKGSITSSAEKLRIFLEGSSGY